MIGFASIITGVSLTIWSISIKKDNQTGCRNMAMLGWGVCFVRDSDNYRIVPSIGITPN